jgi:uncharacterized protein
LDDSTNAATNDQVNAPSHRSKFARSIFIGADGLRAGWSLVIFMTFLGTLLAGMIAIANLLHLLPEKSPAGTEIDLRFGFLAECIPLLATLVVTWVMSKIERRPNSVYGLGGKRPLSNFFAGLAWGFVCLSLLVLTLWKAGLLAFDSRLLFGAEALRYGLVWLLIFFLVGLQEEYLTRGYVLYTLTRGLAGIYGWLFKARHSQSLGFCTAALVLSVVFGLGHHNNPGESPLGLVSACLVGLVFCLSLWRTGSLWWAIGFHSSWDWGQSFVYGVADSGFMIQHHLLAAHPLGKPLTSGGTTGPEGSILVLPTLALASLIIVSTLRRESYRY